MLALLTKRTAFQLTLECRFVFYMRNKVAKRLRKEAQKETIGQSIKATRMVYREKKKQHKAK